MAEQTVQVLEGVFGVLFGFLTKFLLHFLDLHRYDSPVMALDYLGVRSVRKRGAFAVGGCFDSSYPSCTCFSPAPTTLPLPTPPVALEIALGSRLPPSHPPSHPSCGLPCSVGRTQAERFR